MKKFKEILIFTSIFSILLLSSCEPLNDVRNSKKKEANKIENIEDKQVSFMGGSPNNFSKWVQKRLKYPKEAKIKKIQGVVKLNFTIETDGSLSNIKVIKSVDPLLDNEAIRIVSMSPKWEPAIKDGKKVKAKYVFPVIFKLKK